MFDSHFRTVFLSNPAHLRLQSKRLIIERKNTVCHTEAPQEAEVSQQNSRDSSLPAEAQNDNSRDTSLATLAQYDKNTKYNDKEIDCHAKSSDFARNDRLACHTEGVHSTTEVSQSQNDNRDISVSTKPQYDKDLDCHENSNEFSHNDSAHNQYTPYKSNKRDEVAIPLSDIACIILESPQITLTSALLDALATHKVAVFSCDSSHLPSGIFTPFLGHYRSLSILNSQIALKKQAKATLWQQIIKSKISNQCAVLRLAKPNDTKAIDTLANLAKSVELGDASNNEAKAAAVYFRALFGAGFTRMREGESGTHSGINGFINSALNYGYAIVRGGIVRSLASSGLSPALGLFHANAFNPFNLADDIIEPYRAFVDSLVLHIAESGSFGKLDNQHSAGIETGLSLANRVQLAQILSAQVCVKSNLNPQDKGKIYPLMRACIATVQSVANAIEANCKISGVGLALPVFSPDSIKDISNGREVYARASDV